MPLACGNHGTGTTQKPPSGVSDGALHVAVAGNDGNDGSSSNPWKTIQHAANSAQAGQTVIVEDGTYNEALAINRGGGPQAAITLRARNQGGAKIAPPSTDGNHSTTVFVSGSNVVIQGFDITGTPNTSTGIKLAGTRNSLINNMVHDVGAGSSSCISGAAILVANDNETVNGNLIYNVGPSRSAGFRCNQQHGIYITAGGGGFVQNNVLVQIWQGVALHLNGSNLSSWTVTNNTIVNVGDTSHNTGGPFFFDCLGGICENNLFNNNIFANTQGGFCFWEVHEAGAIIGPNQYLNNLTFGCGSNIWVNGNAQNTVTADPQFVNNTGSPSGDYHLLPSSPAIDRGTPSGAPATDKDGVPRPQGAGFDIGAYEATK
jgi:hypothetical protein